MTPGSLNENFRAPAPKERFVSCRLKAVLELFPPVPGLKIKRLSNDQTQLKSSLKGILSDYAPGANLFTPHCEAI
jgi:hypothetical protein